MKGKQFQYFARHLILQIDGAILSQEPFAENALSPTDAVPKGMWCSRRRLLPQVATQA